MPFELKATRAKKSLYLLIPKDIAELLGLNDKTNFKLTVKNAEQKPKLEYEVKNSH